MITQKEYSRLVKEKSPGTNSLKNCISAFLVGGAICTLGQGLSELYKYLGTLEVQAKTLSSVTLIFIGVLLTTVGVYDKIAKHAGAGTLVPVTGFANSVSAPAIEFKTDERDIIGLSRKAP